MRLTNGQPNLGWFWAVTRHGLILWIGTCFLIWMSDLNRFWEVLYTTSRIGLPLSLLILVGLLVLLVFTGTQLTFTEMRNEQLALLRLTNITQAAIFWSLVSGVIYRTRRWLGLIIGGCPVLIWIICGWCTFGTFGAIGLAVCYVSPLGNTYCYFDGPSQFVRWLDVFWILSITISILGIGLLATLCSVGFTMKIKNAASSAVGVLALTVPLIIVVILLVAPEGFLFIDTVYGKARWGALYQQVFCAGLVTAVLPFVVLLGAQCLLRQWAFS